jgi:hypothetical protein
VAGRHKFIGIWLVVVNERVFVRSWSVQPRGRYQTLLEVRANRTDVSIIIGYSRRPERGRACDLALLMELKKAVQ